MKSAQDLNMRTMISALIPIGIFVLFGVYFSYTGIQSAWETFNTGSMKDIPYKPDNAAIIADAALDSGLLALGFFLALSTTLTTQGKKLITILGKGSPFKGYGFLILMYAITIAIWKLFNFDWILTSVTWLIVMGIILLATQILLKPEEKDGPSQAESAPVLGATKSEEPTSAKPHLSHGDGDGI